MSIQNNYTYIINFFDVLHAVESIGLDADMVAKWAIQDDPILNRNRTQFVSVAPFLVMKVSDPTSGYLWKELDVLVARGEPLIEWCNSKFKVKPKTIRNLLGRSPMELGRDWMMHPEELIAAVNLLSPDRLPLSFDGWRVMRRLWLESRPYNDSSWRDKKPVNLSEHLFVSLCGSAYLKRGKGASLFIENDSAAYGFSQFLDFVQEWASEILRQAGLNEQQSTYGEIVVLDLLMARYSGSEILAQFKRWSQELRKRWELTYDSLQVWPPLPRFMALNRLHLEGLSSSSDLIEEGKRLEHCVGSYEWRCVQGRCHIYSIRTDSNQRLGTVEIELVQQPTSKVIVPNVVQIRGVRNSQPESACLAAVREWLEFSVEYSVQVKLESILEFHAQVDRMNLVATANAIMRKEFDVAESVLRKTFRNYPGAKTYVVELCDKIKNTPENDLVNFNEESDRFDEADEELMVADQIRHEQWLAEGCNS